MGKLYLGEERVNFAVNDGGVDNDSNIMLGVSGNSLTKASMKFKMPEGATKVAAYGLAYAFYESTTLEEANLSSLVEVSGSSAFLSAFQLCVNLEKIDISNLRSINGVSAFNSAFMRCDKITELRFNSLSAMAYASCFTYAFRQMGSLTDIYFPALTAASFGSNVNQFTNCLLSTNGATLHFPASVRANIEAMTGYPLFGGTNTIIAFDL